jgi:predicted CXXCH cytochrome family protein
MDCHNPHATDVAALLTKASPKLCLDCHDEDDMKKVKTHQQFPKKDCVSCHDPHGGSDDRFLKPGALKAH